MELTPTTYAGITFRDQTVAQWACFLDALSIPWASKPQTFQVSHGQSYSPDFWLPDQQAWLDILSDELQLDPEQNTAVDLYRITGKTALVFTGFPVVVPFLSNSDGAPVQEIRNRCLSFRAQREISYNA